MFPFDYLVSARLSQPVKTELANKLTVLLRPVTFEDAPRLQQGFKQLSALARGRHFPGANLQELGPAQLELLKQIDGKNYAMWGAMNPAKSDEPGVGIARYKRLSHEPDAADVVITVMDRYQRTGAGMLLHAALHFTAHANGITRFYYDVNHENQRFIRHLQNLGAELVGKVVGVTRLQLPVFPRALAVPQFNPSGLKFARAMRSLVSARAA